MTTARQQQWQRWADHAISGPIHQGQGQTSLAIQILNRGLRNVRSPRPASSLES